MFVLLNKHRALHGNSWATEENVTSAVQLMGAGGGGGREGG